MAKIVRPPLTPPARAESQKRRRFSPELSVPPAREPDRDLATPRPSVSPFLVPRVKMHVSEIVQLPLDHRAGFVLALVDGKTSVQTIVDIAGMDEAEVMDMLASLLLFGVIGPK